MVINEHCSWLILLCRYEVTKKGRFVLKGLMHVLKQAKAAAGESEVRRKMGRADKLNVKYLAPYDPLRSFALLLADRPYLAVMRSSAQPGACICSH